MVVLRTYVTIISNNKILRISADNIHTQKLAAELWSAFLDVSFIVFQNRKDLGSSYVTIPVKSFTPEVSYVYLSTG